jgi:hypothetical protein
MCMNTYKQFVKRYKIVRMTITEGKMGRKTTISVQWHIALRDLNQTIMTFTKYLRNPMSSNTKKYLNK